MGDNSWWFNKAGKVAPASNPGSATPNYGLTYDLATTPTDSTDQFDEMAAGITSYLMSLVGMQPQGTGQVFHGSAQANGPSVWDRLSTGAGAVGNTLASTAGEISNATKYAYSFGHEDVDWSWEGAGQDSKADTGKALGAFAEAPGPKQIFWGLEKLNEYSSTAFVAATLAEDDTSLFFQSGVWGDAHALTKDRHLNAGEAFAQMFYDKEVLLDEQRFEQIRQHNTVFNVGALAFNVIAAWKADPNVIFGKGLGQARDLSMGKLAESGRTREVQREVLSAPSLAEAKTVASSYTSLADKLRAMHSISLYDRSQQLRLAAQEMGFEDFKNLPAFRSSASGMPMAKLFKDVADSDESWNLVFRSALGDPDAVELVRGLAGGVGDKIAAIELKTMPALQKDLERTEARYAKRLAEQGKPQDARIEITRFGDKWLDDEVTSLRAEADGLAAQLAFYESHESWLQRALPSLDEDGGLAGRNAANSISGNLDRLGGQGPLRRSLSFNGGSVKMWQHDDYSPVSWAFRAPTKPFLKRVGVVSLNDVDDGGQALVSYLDQLDYVRGVKHQTGRDNVLAAWAGSTSDMERKQIVERLEREAITALGTKHGLSTEIMDRLGQELQKNRSTTWGKFSDTMMYSPIRGSRGQELEWVDDAGNMTRVKMPIDPSQLANWHPLTNLTDLDRQIRLHADTLRSLDVDLATRKQAGAAWTERHVREFADEIGSSFNSFWKPLALLSIRWPARVIADESMRVILLAGALPHLAKWGQAGKNALYNSGVVRPYEWWNGRKIKVGSLADDSLRAGRIDYDAFDYRALTNPSAAVPINELDLGKIDMKRYDKLNAKTAARWQYLRSLEAHRAQTRAAKKVSPEVADAVAAFTAPERPRWATAWDDNLAQAQRSAERGFFFDPLTPNKSINKGFAVSAYPGRLRTFETKPSARELNYWIEKNSDLLGVPTNRVAVWLDKDTGRWHLDVVKTTRRKEDAMLLASRVEATEFYDIEDGFTRFMSEDYWDHFRSPFVKPPAVGGGPAGVGFDQAPIAAEADAIGGELGGVLGQGAKPTRKAVGFGAAKWRSRDGRVVHGEQVFGPNTDNPNIYHGVVSSKSAIQNLYGGHTKGIGADRAARQASDYRVFDPTDPNTNLDEWATAWSHFVNNHIRYSPIASRMLEGQSDDEIFAWLHTSAGRKARQRIGIRGENPDKWVSDIREIFDHMFPTERALEAARLGEVDPKKVLDLIPEGLRPEVHGDTIKMGLGTATGLKTAGKVVDFLMTYLGSVPTDALVRHPFAATVYNREMRNYLSSVPAHKVTNNVLAAAEASARATALRRVKRTLYNIADEREGVHMLRFVSPFFQAQLEVLERYARLSMEKPETVARLAQLLVGSQTLATGLWDVVGRDGKPAEGYSGENQVVFQVTDTMRKLVDKFPGLDGALDNAGEIVIPVASLNLVLQGDKPYLPSMGPLVTYPASEFYYKDRPELEHSAVYHWMFPYGVPKGSNFIERFGNSVLPAYMKRGLVGGTADFDDSAFARRVSEIGAQQLLTWELNGKEGPRPTERDALNAAKNEYRLRTASSFFLPAPLTPRSPYQFWIDQYRSFKEKYGVDADEKFYDEYGPEYFLFAQQATESTGGMGPDAGEKKAFDRYHDLAERAPDLIGVLTGPFATGEFSDAVYQWQLSTKLSPTSSENLREHLSPAERIAESEVNRGWVEYGKLASAIDAEIRNRVAQGGSAYLTASSNADLKAIKDSKILEIITRNPGWQDDYKNRSANMESWLTQAYDVAFDPKLDGRTDIEALRTYLISRARLQDALRVRKDTGQSSSAQLSFDPLGNPVGDNADLAAAWGSYVNELTASNLLFAEIYNRYLEGDDLSTYINPEVSGGN